MKRQKTVLVLYHMRGAFPLRSSVDAHLYCWARYSQHKTIYINTALSDARQTLSKSDPDVIILHTSFCGLRWQGDQFEQHFPLMDALRRSPALKIAKPQDEFYLTDRLNELLRRVGISVVLTCADRQSWPTIYGELPAEVRLKTVLTGYLDPGFVRRARRMHRPHTKRRVAVSYRAWRAEYWLGAHGQKKVQVASKVKTALEQRGILSDISLDDADTITGRKWVQFLAESGATIGVEGGASLIDRDGSIRAAVARYVQDNPDAGFDEVEAECFAGRDGELNLKCLSPRHLEAAATHTLQLLVRGGYNNALEPGRHYIELEPDFANLDSALDVLSDTEQVKVITDSAYLEIVESGRYSYPGFVREIEAEFLEDVAGEANLQPTSFEFFAARIRDWLNWRIIELECAYLKRPHLFRPFGVLLKPIYRSLKS